MALKRQVVEIVFSEGLDQKTGLLVRKPGMLRTADNVVFDKGGTLNKRHGYRYVPLDDIVENTGFVPEASFLNLAQLNGNLVVFGRDFVYEIVDYANNANAATATRIGPSMVGAFKTSHVVTGGYGD